jgi:hypothetical protein
MVSELVGASDLSEELANSAGWSTQIPNYNPLEIVENLQRLMKGEEVEKMTPWFRGFKVCLLFQIRLIKGNNRKNRGRQVQD